MSTNSAVISPAAIQGVASPDLVVDPDKFYMATRRLKFPARPNQAIAGIGSQDVVTLRQTGIIAALECRISGTVTFGGTIGTTTLSYEWPFGIVQRFQLSANGQSNLLQARGLTFRLFDFVMNHDLVDNGGPAVTFGAVAIPSGVSGGWKIPGDDWGTLTTNALNPGANVPAVGVYTVDITFVLPIAADMVSLIGSIFAQSAATNLTLTVQYATQAQLFSAVGGSATVAYALSLQVQAVAFSIPNVGGKFVVPDLSQFHQIAEYQPPGITQGTNQPVLPGTGVGRRLMRVFGQVYSGAVATPIPVTAANYGQIGWAFGGNDMPESYDNGTQVRASLVRDCGVDLCTYWGWFGIDFASQFALRDLVDQGTTSDLRMLYNLVGAPTAPVSQVVQEVLFAAPVGA